MNYKENIDEKMMKTINGQLHEFEVEPANYFRYIFIKRLLNKKYPNFDLDLFREELFNAKFSENLYVLMQNLPEFSKEEANLLLEVVINKCSIDKLIMFSYYVKNVDSKKIEYYIAENGNCENIIDYIKIAPNYNVKLMQKAILQKGDMNSYIDFASVADGADIQLFENKVIKSGSILDMVKFLKSVPNCNDEKLLLEILKRSSIETFCELVKDFLDKDSIEMCQLLLKCGNINKLISWAKIIKKIDFEWIEESLAKKKEYKNLIKFLVAIDRTQDIEKYKEEILRNGNMQDIIALTTISIDLTQRLENYIVANANSNEILSYLKDNKYCDFKKVLARMIIKNEEKELKSSLFNIEEIYEYIIGAFIENELKHSINNTKEILNDDANKEIKLFLQNFKIENNNNLKKAKKNCENENCR